MKRHHLLLVGLLLFFAGVQFRLVESFTLSEKSSRFVAAQVSRAGTPQAAMWQNAPGRKVVQPPRWVGLACVSQAPEGGGSGLASAVAVHDHLARHQPQALRRLHRCFHRHHLHCARCT